MSSKNKNMFYAVQRGVIPGIYPTCFFGRKECEAQIKGFPHARFQKFPTRHEAEAFVAGVSSSDFSATQTSTSVSKGKKRDFGPEVHDVTGWDIVYSDGACKGNGKAGSIAGVGVWWGRDDPRNIAERCPGDQTNNRAELIAILRVLETTPITKKPLLIRTDSQYSIECFRSWIHNWERRGWRTAGGAPVKNVGIIRYISAHLSTRSKAGQKVLFEYVKGHSGDIGNDGADEMANIGAMQIAQPERDWEALTKALVERSLGQHASIIPPELTILAPSSEELRAAKESAETSEPPTKAPKLAIDGHNIASTSSRQNFSKVHTKTASTKATQVSSSPVKATAGSSRTVVTTTPRESSGIISNHPVHAKSPLKVIYVEPPLVPVRVEDVNLNDYADCILDDCDLAAELSD